MSRKNTGTFTAALTVLSLWAVAFSFTLLFSDCMGNGNGSDTAIPRRTAYPRIEIYDSAYTAVGQFPINIEVNENAVAQPDSAHTPSANRWLNIIYPRYNATLHCTYSPVDTSTISSVMDNRTERMFLNAGDLTSEFTELNTPSGISGSILVTPDSKVTPVQFIATDRKRWVFSGALYFGNALTDADSIAPVIKAVKRDIIHTIKNLRDDESL